MLGFLQNLAIPLVIAVASVWLAMGRFRYERRWDRKADAYERIVVALHRIKIFDARSAEAEYQKREMPEDERTKQLLELAAEAHDEILKAIDIAALYLPDEVQLRLRRYRTEEQNAKNSSDWFKYLEADWAAADACLNDLIEIAKRDLRMKSAALRFCAAVMRLIGSDPT
jgi:hypothetical protein